MNKDITLENLEKVLNNLAYLPTICEWYKNGTSEDYIRGYNFAIQKVMECFDIELDRNYLDNKGDK